MSLLNPREPQIPGTVSGDIFQAHMRRVGLLPEDEEERHARQQQHELEPYDPNPISNVRIGEEKTYWDIAKSGGATGLAGGAKGIISAVESFGFGNDSTRSMIDHLNTIEVEHAPPEAIQGELRNNPWLLLDPTWWAYNVPNFAASTAPMLVGGGAAGLATKAIARMIPGLAGSAATARTAFGGALNMMTVGGSVYAEQVEQGASHEEAALLSHQSMLVDAPFAYLEALLFLNPKLFAARLPKALRSTTRKGHILQSSAVESFQEAGETIFADNLIQGKPWQSGVLEALISGPVVGGPIAAVQGAVGYDPAVMHAQLIEQLKVGEGIEGLNNPDLSTEERLELTDRAADPAFSPQRIAWLEQRVTREDIDGASKAAGNDVPLGDAEWTDMLKDDLRLIGYYEYELDGRGIEELEALRDDATRRMDRTVPPEHRTERLMSDILLSPYEAARRGEEPLLYGDTFVLTDSDGVPDYTHVYRVTQLGVVQRDETGKPILFGPDDPVPGVPRPPVGGVRAIDIASDEELETALELDPDFDEMDAARKNLGVEITDNAMIMVISRSRLRGKNMSVTAPAEAAPEVPPLTSGVTGEVTPPLEPGRGGGVFLPISGAEKKGRLLGEGEGPPLQAPFVEGVDETSFVVTSGRDARGRYAKPSIRDVRSGAEDPATAGEVPETADRPVAEGGGQLATPAMDRHLLNEIMAEQEVEEVISEYEDVDMPPSEEATLSPKEKAARKKAAPAQTLAETPELQLTEEDLAGVTTPEPVVEEAPLKPVAPFLPGEEIDEIVAGVTEPGPATVESAETVVEKAPFMPDPSKEVIPKLDVVSRQGFDEVLESFPSTFGLRRYPGQTFRASPQVGTTGVEGEDSYISRDPAPSTAGSYRVVPQRLTEEGRWESFAAQSPEELRAEIVEAPESTAEPVVEEAPELPLHRQTPTDPVKIAEIYRLPLAQILAPIGPASGTKTARNFNQLKNDAKALNIPIKGADLKSKEALAQLIRLTVLERDEVLRRETEDQPQGIKIAPDILAKARGLYAPLLLTSKYEGISESDKEAIIRIMARDIADPRDDPVTLDEAIAVVTGDIGTKGHEPHVPTGEEIAVDEIIPTDEEVAAEEAKELKAKEEYDARMNAARDRAGMPSVPIRRIEEGVSGLDPGTVSVEGLSPGQTVDDVVSPAAPAPTPTPAPAPAPAPRPGVRLAQAIADVSAAPTLRAKLEMLDDKYQNMFWAMQEGGSDGFLGEVFRGKLELTTDQLTDVNNQIGGLLTDQRIYGAATPTPAPAAAPKAAPATIESFSEVIDSIPEKLRVTLNNINKYLPTVDGEKVELVRGEGYLYFDDMRLTLDAEGRGGTSVEGTMHLKTMSVREWVQEYYDKVLSAGDTHPLHPDYVTETEAAPEAAPAPEEIIEDILPTAKPEAKGFKRPVTGLHEKNPDDPPESFWREEVAPGVTRIQQMLDDGAGVLWRPWMTSDEKGRALVNLGFKREGKRRNELTKHRPGAKSITMGFPEDIIDAYYDFLSGKKTTTAPAKPGEDTIEDVIATFPETFALRAFPGDLFRVAGPPKSWIDQQGKAQIVVEVERDGTWLELGRDTPENVRQEIVAEQTLAETPGLQLTEEDLAGVTTPTPTPAAALAPAPTTTPPTSVSANQPPRKLVVSGGRNYSDGQRLYDELDRQHAAWPIAEIVHGNASGADRIADRWAADRKIRVRKFPANWKQLGRKAGPMRNAQMAKYGDHLVAFPGDRGTSSMMKEMAKVKKPAMSSLDRQELLDIPGGVETASVENLETGKNHPALPGLFGEATPTPAAAPTPEAEVLEKPEFMPPVQKVPEGVSGEDVEVSEAKRAALVEQVKNLTDEQVLDRTTEALRKLATDVGVDPDEIKLGFYIRKSGKLKGQWVRSKPERNEPATRASLVYSIRKLFGQTQDISTEVAPEEQVESSLDRGEVPAAASDVEVTMAEVMESLTDKEILELGQAELIDNIETRVDMGGLGLGSQLWNPYVTEKGKTVKPNNFMKPNKRRLLEIIRSKYPYSAAVKQELDKRLAVTPPSPEATAPAATPTPAAAHSESQDVANLFDFIDDRESSYGMDDQDLSALIGDEAIEEEIAAHRDKSEPMSEGEEAAHFFAMMDEMNAALSEPLNIKGISISDLKVRDKDGKEGKYGRTSSGNNVVVWMENEKRPRNIPADTLELESSNMLRVKSRVQVSDQAIADARSLVRGVSDKNMNKIFKDKNGRVSLDKFITWAKGIGASVPDKATRSDVVSAVRRRLALAEGEGNKQEPTDRGDILEDFLRATKKKFSLISLPANASTSGIMLHDGTFYDLGDEIHAEFMSRAYDEAFPLGPGTRFDAFKKEYTDFGERRGQENAWGIRDDVIQDFMADTGALRVSVGGRGLIIEGNESPSSAQLSAIKSAVKSGRWSNVDLEWTDVAHTQVTVDDIGPRVASMVITNFWLKALEKQTRGRVKDTLDTLSGDPRLNLRDFMGGQRQAAPIIYTSEELNPFTDEEAERVALIAARFSPDAENPQAWGRAWVLVHKNTDAARREALRITERNSKVRLPAELRRRIGLSAVPATAKSVLDIMDVPVEVGMSTFIGVAAQAQNAVRNMVIDGDADGLAFLQTRIRKGVNKGDPMSIVVQNAINMLRPTTRDSSFMPDPSDLQDVVHVEPPSWDVPLIDPLSESLAQQAVRNNINGVAPRNLDENTQMTIARAREVEWHQKFGPKPQILGAAVSRSLRNPHMYTPNDDLLVRTPRAKHKGYKTLLHTVQQMMRKGVMKWQGATLQRKNPLEDIAVLGQVIRDARVENFIVYYINDDNVVVGSTIVSSRKPNETENLNVIGWNFVAAKAGSLGATRIATSHNHPSGVPSPSLSDLSATRKEGIDARRHGLEHMGHVIVDNTQYFELDPYASKAADNSGLKLLPPDIGKNLRRSPYLDPLTTPGLEAKAIHEAEWEHTKMEYLEMARGSVIRAHVGAGRSLSPEDRATYMYNITHSALPAELFVARLSDVKAQVLEQATRIAHDNEVAVVVHLDAMNKITSVQSVDIETLRDEDTVFDVIDKRVAGSYYTYVYLSSEAAARQTNTADGFDQTVGGFLNRLYKTDHIQGYATQEVNHDIDTDKNKQRYEGGYEAGTPSQDFRSVYANLSPDWQERVLFALGNSPGLRAGELHKKEALWKLVDANRKWFDKYRADDNEHIIRHFVNMGVNKAIDLKMLRMLAPNEDPVNMPWRDMTEKSFINRRSTPKHGSQQQTGPAEVVSKVIRPVQKMIDATRNHETIPIDPNEPGVSHFRKFNMASLDNVDKYTAAEETLARPETMMGRLFQDFEVKDFRGLIRELGNVVRNIGKGVGIRRSVLAGIKRVNPFMAKWLYDTEHALNVWVDLVNEHRLGKGGKALSAVANPRDALDLSRNVGGKIEAKLKEYNSILMIYNDGVGLNDQEMIDVSVYLAALQSKKRINTAEHRYDSLEALKTDRKDQGDIIKELKARLRKKDLDPVTRKNIEDTLFTTQAYHAEIIREIKALRKLVVEEVVYDEDGNAIDKRFNPELINPGGATAETADAAMNEIKARLIKQLGDKAGAAKFENLTDVAREMHLFWDGMLDISIDAGLVSQEDAMYMKEANEAHGDYMSPFDIIRHYNTATMSGGGGPRNRSSMSIFDHQLYKHMVATTSESRDPILSSTDKIAAVISFAAKNKATKTFHDTRLLWDGSGEVDPELESVMMNLEEGDEVPKDFRRIYYWQDGKRVSFAAYAPVADVLLGLNRPVAGPIMRVVKQFTRVLRAGATALSPSFIVFNIPRDLMTQYISADAPLSPFVMDDIKLFGNSMWTALKASWNPETVDPLLEEFMAWGAGYGGEISQSMFTGTEEDIKKLRGSGARRKKFLGRDIETGDATLDRMAKTASWVTGMLNPFGSGLSLSEALEQGTRFAVFQKQLQASGVDVSIAGLKGLETTTDEQGRIVDSEGNVITAEEAEERETKRQKAIFAGRRATVDFSRGGKAFLYMNMMAPFTNAAVQGVRTVSGGIMEHPTRAKTMMAAGALTAILLNIMNRMNYGDLLDEEEDWKRRKSFTMIVGTWKDDQGKEHPISLHMPKGDLLSAVTVPFEDFIDHLYRAQSDPNVGYTDNAVGGMFSTMVEMFSEYSPIEFERDGVLSLGLIASKFLPTPIRATFETYTDKNFYFDREIEGRLKGLLTEDRINRDTTELAVFMSGLAGSVFDITGDRETNPFSPVVIDHIVKSMAGEGGHIATSLLGKIGGAIISPQEALFGVAESFDAPWGDWVETAAYTPGIKRLISVRGGKQERLQMRTLERVQQIIGSRRASQLRPVLDLMRERRRLSGQEFMEKVNEFGPEQLSMLKMEMEREASGLGRNESVARTLRSMPIRTWGRAIGIIELMNNNITRPIDRAEFIRGLAYAKLLTPMVMAQVMLLAGSGVLYRPDGVVPGAPGLRRVSGVRELAQPGFLPIMPEVR